MADGWDVAVVGAGPAGAASAALLAGLGMRVVLLDRAHFPRPKACAEYMSPGVAQVLQRIGVAAEVESSSPLRVPGMDIISPRGTVLRVQYRQGHEPRTAYTLQRHTLDAALVNYAAQRGAEVIEGFVARDALRVGAVVAGVTGSLAGLPREIPARLTLIADGARSSMARALGIAVPPRWPRRMGLVAHYGSITAPSDGFGRMVVSDGGYCGVAPLPGNQLNVAVVVGGDAVKRSGFTATKFFDRWVAAEGRVSDMLRGAARISPVRGVCPIGSRTSRVWLPGAMLVGDAAGFFDPFTGEGIHRALRGAELVATLAPQALSGGDSALQALANYPALRSQAFRSKQAVTALVQLFVQYPNLMEYALSRLATRPTPSAILSNVLGDLTNAGEFLTPRMLGAALRP